MNREARPEQSEDALDRGGPGGPPTGQPRAVRLTRGRFEALAIVAAVFVAAVLIVAGTGEDSKEETAGSGASPLAPTFLPDGYVLVEARQLPRSRDHRAPAASFHLYGRPQDANPFAESDLAVIMTDGADLPEGQPIEVRGHQGVVSQDSIAGGQAISWVENGLSVTAMSRSLTLDRLLDVAEVMDPSVDDPGFEDGELPAHLEPIVSRAERGDDAAGVPFVATSRSYQVSYRGEADGLPAGTLEVVTAAATPTELDVVRWRFGADARSVTVRGHEGVLASPGRAQRALQGSLKPDGSGPGKSREAASHVKRAPTLTLAWNEAAGVVAILVGVGIDEDTLLRVAEGLDALSEEQWSALRARAPSRPG